MQVRGQDVRGDGFLQNKTCLAFLFFVLLVSILPLTSWLTAIPGDLVDARFNSVILEHMYRWVLGRDTSLWNPSFFYPFDGALAFSDNHFGSFFSYAAARLLGADREQAYLFWFVLGATLNYLAAYYVLRRMYFSPFAAAIGAVIFSVGLPAAMKASHAQLVHRFAVPMAVLCFWRFFRQGCALDFFWMVFWVSWQFLCSIYLGVFLTFLLVAFFIGWMVFGRRRFWWGRLIASWKSAPRVRRLGVVLLASCLSIGTLLMLKKYMDVSSSYGFVRSVTEVDSMLPRWQSYLYAPMSILYHGLMSGKDIPMEHEHHMFIGAFAGMLLLSGGWFTCSAGKQRPLALVALVSLAFLITLTLNINGLSIYHLVIKLPGVSSVRAVARIALIMLFPAAILISFSVEKLGERIRSCWGRRGDVCLSVLIALSIGTELFLFNPYNTPVAWWKARRVDARATLPARYEHSGILYMKSAHVVQNSVFDIDGMILAQDLGVTTLNGYSGNLPPDGWVGKQDIYACVDYLPRLDAYSKRASKLGIAFDEAAVTKKVIVLSPPGCDGKPIMPDSIPGEQARLISVTPSWKGNQGTVVRIQNFSKEVVYSKMRTGQLRLSWRIIPDGIMVAKGDGWDARADFSGEIAPGKDISVEIKPAVPSKPGKYLLQVSLVHEGVVWLHNIGMEIGETQFSVD